MTWAQLMNACLRSLSDLHVPLEATLGVILLDENLYDRINQVLVSWIQEICGSIKETANVFYFYIYFFRTKYKFLSQWRKYTKAKSLSVTYLKFRAGAGLTFSQRAARAELLHEGR